MESGVGGASMVRSQHATAKRMKMAYEYTRVTQVFTISSVPPCWVYPVSLLVHAYANRDQQTEQELAINPNFPDEETLAATEDQYYTELISGREYQTVLPTK